MKIIDVTQGSPEWFALREKRITASHAQAIGSCGKGLETYITELMQDFYSSKEKEHFSNYHTDRGNDLEDSASFLYEAEKEVQTRKVGFVIHNDYVGCSPDLFVDEKGLAEIKCPDDKKYFKRLLYKKTGGEMGIPIEKGLLWQMQNQMLICEKDWCDHVEYNPNFKKNLIITRIEIDYEMFRKLEKGFKIGEELIKEIESKMEQIK